MNAESLESLLIDRAIGQLPPEVEALLAEYLAAHPEAARGAAELGETVALTATVLKRPAPRLALPPATVAIFPQRRGHRRLALAASFVAGAGVALLTLRTFAPQPPALIARAPVPVVPVAAPRSAEIDPAIRTLPFWSKERAVALASAKQSTR
jgi:anti-sigma factor RsiW